MSNRWQKIIFPAKTKDIFYRNYLQSGLLVPGKRRSLQKLFAAKNPAEIIFQAKMMFTETSPKNNVAEVTFPGKKIFSEIILRWETLPELFQKICNRSLREHHTLCRIIFQYITYSAAYRKLASKGEGLSLVTR